MVDAPVESSTTNGYAYDSTGPAIVFHGDAIPVRGAMIFVDYTRDPEGPADGP